MNDIRTAQLGYPYNRSELEEYFQTIWGGVAWPGECPGFAVVVGLDRERHFDSFDIILLEEYESSDPLKLIRQCGVLNAKYAPARWIGDRKNDAASRLIGEMNSECRETDRHEFAASHHEFTMSWRGSTTDGRKFSLRSTPLIEMQDLYPYLVAQIAKLTHKDRKQLWLKNGKAAAYLDPIQRDQTAELERGSFPAIEALGYVTVELQNYLIRQEVTYSDDDTFDMGVQDLLEV